MDSEYNVRGSGLFALRSRAFNYLVKSAMRSNMQFFWLIFAVLAKPIIATTTITSTVSLTTTTSEQCNTKAATTSATGAIPTTYTTKSNPDNTVLVRSTSTPYTTVTPSPVTTTSKSTVFVTTTKTLKGVAIFSTTVTTTYTSTSVVTTEFDSTSTVVSTTSSDGTYTWPTPSGFIGVEESSSDTNYTGSSKMMRRDPRAVVGGAVIRRAKSANPPSTYYPGSVTCMLGFFASKLTHH